MTGYQYNFYRKEKKYLLDNDKYQLLLDAISKHLECDQYGEYQICNIYFDTPDFELIQHSINKPLYKEKFRIRSYGTPDEETIVHLEIKKKYDGVVYKRRVSMPYREAIDYCLKGIKPNRNDQIFREVDRVFQRYQLYPMLYLSYDRIAMHGIREKDLRITFDSHLLWRTEELGLIEGIFGNSFLEKGTRIMEIKTNGGMPMWLCHALSELKIYPESFSKYGRIFQDHMTNFSFQGQQGGCRHVI